MKEAVLSFMEQYPSLAVATCFGFAIFVSLVGLIPSFVVTAVAVLFFGFWKGVGITFLGENLGATIAFYLYRRGFKQTVRHKLAKYKAAQKLLNADNKQAFWIIFFMRLIPVLPSGIVTFTSAMGRASLLTFVVAGSLGKLPSLLLEGYAAMQVEEFNWQGKLILSAAALAILYFLVRHILSSRKRKKQIPE